MSCSTDAEELPPPFVVDVYFLTTIVEQLFPLVAMNLRVVSLQHLTFDA